MPLRTHFSRRHFLNGSAATLAAALGATHVVAQQPADVPTIDDWIKKRAADAPLAMQFRGTTAEECRAWKAEFAAKLRALLGPHSPPEKWQTVTERRVELEDHIRDELVLTAEDHPPLPLYVLTPREKSDRRRGGVLALHGHGAHGYEPVAGRDDVPGVAASIKACNYDYGRQLVRRGYIVAVPCLTPFGRRLGKADAYGKQDACAITSLRLQLLGKLLIAENLRDALWTLALLAGDQQVDANCLGCVGLSYGGRMTMLTSALEPRIRVAVISGAMNCVQERISHRYSCGAQVIPGLLQYGDVPEIGSLIAPRPCVWEVGLQDAGMPARWVEVIAERLGRAYTALQAKDQLEIDRFEGGHRWNGGLGYRLLDKVLKA
jgi:dienelactone hydrolase